MHTTAFEWHMTRLVSYKGTLNGTFDNEIDIYPMKHLTLNQILTQPSKSCNSKTQKQKMKKKTMCLMGID